ncbi:MAG: 4Fe-4S dicluster domain-containing protein [Desulfobulbaceae bacterium]|nr:4Fe-4S dicluster domain-containing protein [Desulfobulbaceae bacterium]
MKRRSFLKILGSTLGATLLAGPEQARAALFTSPVTTNRLRPPGAVPEEIFAGKCIRCGRCVEICPYHCITLLDIRHGVFAGTPLIAAEKIPCYLCMKCVDVCPTGSLIRVTQEETRMGVAIIDRFNCFTWVGMTLCRTCYDKCPFKDKAIVLEELKPIINESACTGCGLCTHACPVTVKEGKKAVNIEPLYATAKVKY